MGWDGMGARTPLDLTGLHGPECVLGLCVPPPQALPHNFNLQIKLQSSPSK